MTNKVTSFLTNSSCQCFQARFVVQLIEQTNKESDVSTSVDEMSSGPFIVWFPDLDGHGFGENLLRNLVFGILSSLHLVWIVRVNNMSRLGIYQPSSYGTTEQRSLLLLPCGGASSPCLQISRF